jgi:hypothetical protein
MRDVRDPLSLFDIMKEGPRRAHGNRDRFTIKPGECRNAELVIQDPPSVRFFPDPVREKGKAKREIVS